MGSAFWPGPARASAVLLTALLALCALSGCAPGSPVPATPNPSTATPAASGTDWPPTPEPTTPPTAQPSASSTISGEDPLRTGVLYTVEPDPEACSLPVHPPRPPLPDKDLAPYARQLLKCLTALYAGPLAGAGITLAEPKVNVYRGTIQTQCGKLTQHSAPAYYCAESTTIYWPISGDERSEAFSYARLGYVGLAAHEFGHHVQAVTGILGAYAREQTGAPANRRLELTRRLELQAQCIEGVTLAVQQDALRLTGQDRYELRLWREATGDEDPPKGRIPDHGTSTAQLRWLYRGLDSGDLGRCNTWTASADSVR